MSARSFARRFITTACNQRREITAAARRRVALPAPPPPPCSDGSRSCDGCPPSRREPFAPTWAKACSRCSNASLTPRGSPAHNHRDSLPCPRRNRHAQCRRRTTRVSVTSARTMSMSSLGSGLTCLKTHGANQHQPSTSATAPAPQHQHQHQHQHHQHQHQHHQHHLLHLHHRNHRHNHHHHHHHHHPQPHPNQVALRRQARTGPGGYARARVPGAGLRRDSGHA